jgi:protein subunit release factor A
VGDSDRAEKIRTVQEQNGMVTNHRSGRRCSVKEYLKGRLDLIQ